MEKRQLFGGAITCELPESAIDVSNFRQVPDNQEVFLMEQDTKENDQSIIIELLEPPEGDIKQVLTTHLSDIVDSVGQFDYTKLTSADREQYLVNYEKLVLGLIRVSQFNVDILVTLNNGNDCALVTKIIETLEISDASLFS